MFDSLPSPASLDFLSVTLIPPRLTNNRSLCPFRRLRLASRHEINHGSLSWGSSEPLLRLINESQRMQRRWIDVFHGIDEAEQWRQKECKKRTSQPLSGGFLKHIVSHIIIFAIVSWNPLTKCSRHVLISVLVESPTVDSKVYHQTSWSGSPTPTPLTIAPEPEEAKDLAQKVGCTAPIIAEPANVIQKSHTSKQTLAQSAWQQYKWSRQRHSKSEMQKEIPLEIWRGEGGGCGGC